MAGSFSGTWLSRYTYHSNKRGADAVSENLMKARREDGDWIVFETIPELNDSALVIRLHVAETHIGEVATGTWREETALEGYYGGAVYHGVMQMLIAKDYRRLWGKGLGYDSRRMIQVHDWELLYLAEQLPEGTWPIKSDRPSQNS